MRRDLCLAFAYFAAACGAPDDRAPIARDVLVTTAEDQPAGFVLAVDELDGDPLTWTATAPGHGTLRLAPPVATYVPDPDFFGTDLVEVTVRDRTASSSAFVRFEVTPRDDAPRANPDGFAAVEDQPLALATSALVSNDLEVDGQPLRVVAVEAIDGGSVTLGDDELIFVPAPDHSGLAHLRYTISDGALTATAAITLRLGGANDPPTPADDVLTTAEDQPLRVPHGALLRNDLDPDGDTLSVTVVDDAIGGTVVLEQSDVVFTPAADFHGAASFVYWVSDGPADQVAQVTVWVGAVDDPPTASPITLPGTEDTVLAIPLATLRARSHDPDGDPLLVTSVDDPSLGSVGVVGDEVRFWPAPDATGAAGFTYTVADGTRQASARVTIELVAVDDPPIALDQLRATREGEPVAFTLLGRDVDTATWTFEVIAPPGHGTLGAGPDPGELWYQPAPGYWGTDVVTFVVHADGQTSAPAQVQLLVAEVQGCGDSTVDLGEACDDGNSIDGDGCDHDCSLTGCGNGVAASPPVTAATLRWLGASCGDPTREVVLTIDDAVAVAVPGGDGTCGCDEPVREAHLDPAAVARLSGRAVFALRFPGDDAHLAWAELEIVRAGVTDAITLYAARPHVAGEPWPQDLCQAGNDAAVATQTQAVVSEECDDGNVAADDGCSPRCALEVCGDGARQPGEACDDGNLAAEDGCDPTCRREPCGDLIVDGDEACDDGNRIDGDGCDHACAIERCGDGAIQPGLGEECDDGNLVPDDGCSPSCTEG